MPQMFGTITVTDGISMGTEGMKYSLVSREVIADAIETAAQSQFMDGVLAIGGCDKNMPGAMIGTPAHEHARDLRLRRHHQAGHATRARTCTIVSVFESVGAFTAGKMSKEDFECIERKALPGVGACGGMYTANTMSSSVEARGHVAAVLLARWRPRTRRSARAPRESMRSAGRGGEEET